MKKLIYVFILLVLVSACHRKRPINCWHIFTTYYKYIDTDTMKPVLLMDDLFHVYLLDSISQDSITIDWKRKPLSSPAYIYYCCPKHYFLEYKENDTTIVYDWHPSLNCATTRVDSINKR